MAAYHQLVSSFGIKIKKHQLITDAGAILNEQVQSGSFNNKTKEINN
jgi:hypothetical protein